MTDRKTTGSLLRSTSPNLIFVSLSYYLRSYMPLFISSSKIFNDEADWFKSIVVLSSEILIVYFTLTLELLSKAELSYYISLLRYLSITLCKALSSISD